MVYRTLRIIVGPIPTLPNLIPIQINEVKRLLFCTRLQNFTVFKKTVYTYIIIYLDTCNIYINNYYNYMFL